MAQKKVFRTDLKGFTKLAIPGLVLSAVLIYLGIRQYIYMPRTLGFPPDWLLYGTPWATAALILLFTAYVYWVNKDKKIVVTPQYLEFMRGENTLFRCVWNNLSFTPPRQDKKRFRVAVISDGNRFERLEEFFFPEFDLLVDILKEAKRHARDELSTS